MVQPVGTEDWDLDLGLTMMMAIKAGESAQTLNALILAILVTHLCSKELFLNDKYLLI